MGEEKNAQEGEKKSEEKKSEEVKNKEGEKEGKEKEEKKTKEEEAKKANGNEENKKENKDSIDEQPPPPPPPPPEIVLRVYMHCEGCARKVKKCLKGFIGVEDVTTDCKTHKVVVKGEKADPLMVLDRVQKKTHRQVELLSPIPPPKPVEEPKKVEDKEPPKPQEKKEEPKVITVVLKVHMHCEACSLEIKKRIERMKEVEEAIPDLKSSQVTVKGTFEASKLVDYVYKRTGRKATIVKQDPPPEKKEDPKDGKEEKKGENGEEGKKGDQKAEEGKSEKKEEAASSGGADGGGDGGKAAADGGDAATAVEEGPKIVELRRNEFMYYPPRYAMEMNAYPPQIFSDENPNACSIM